MFTEQVLPRVSGPERRPGPLTRPVTRPADGALSGRAARGKVQAEAPSDISLLTRMATGDRLALHAFYARHHVRVYRFVLRILGDPTLAEDVISDVFIDAWRQAGNFEGRSAVSTWLLAIARHKAFAVLRRRPTESLDQETAAEIQDTSDTPEVALQKQNRGIVLRRCLSALPVAHREIIDLVYYHEKSVAEVAMIFAIPENTVKTRLFYARKKLATLARAAGLDRDAL
jgi:RNA polymerase sigma-70 factor (ECF subfamily)